MLFSKIAINNKLIMNLKNKQQFLWIDDLKLKWIADDDNSNITFERVTNCVWLEKHDNKEVNTYSTVLFDIENGWLLFDSINNNFVQINDFELRKGDCIQFMKKIYEGRWFSDLNDNERQNKSFKEQLNSLGASKLIYIDWKADQVKNFLQLMKTYIDTNLA